MLLMIFNAAIHPDSIVSFGLNMLVRQITASDVRVIEIYTDGRTAGQTT